jgi:hypothetical protein
MLAISAEGGNVRIDFGEPTAWIALGPDQAMALASAIWLRARALKDALAPPE